MNNRKILMLDLKHEVNNIDIVALIAIDHKGWPALIKYTPKDWWEDFMNGDDFIDIFDSKTPDKPGIYWWKGYFRVNTNVGRCMPNSEVDDWPGAWIGKWFPSGFGEQF